MFTLMADVARTRHLVMEQPSEISSHVKHTMSRLDKATDVKHMRDKAILPIEATDIPKNMTDKVILPAAVDTTGVMGTKDKVILPIEATDVLMNMRDKAILPFVVDITTGVKNMTHEMNLQAEEATGVLMTMRDL